MDEFKSTISSQDFDKALQGGLDYAADKGGIWEALENAGGISDTEKAFMLTLFKNAAYTADVSATITKLEALWSGSEEPDEPIEPDDPDVPVVTTYTVTNTLTNVTNSNTAASVTEGASYTATLTADEGYNIDSVTVTVGGVDVTASVYANGVVSISNVSGNIVITATAVASGGSGEGVSNLLNFNGDTIVSPGTGTATILDDHSVVVSGGSVLVIVNGLTPGDQYSLDFDNGASFSVYGSVEDNITSEPTTTTQIRPNGTATADDLPYVFTLPNTCHALIITIYTGTWSNMVLENLVDPLEGSPYELTLIANEYPDKSTGVIKPYNGWMRTDYTPCYGVAKLRTYQSGNEKDSRDTAFYDESKNFISGGFYVIGGSPIAVPDNAHYFILSGETTLMNGLTVIPIKSEV